MKIKPPLPDARIDGFDLGFTARVPGFWCKPRANLTDALKQIGRITTPRSKTGDGYDQISFDLETEAGHPAGCLRINIFARRDGDDLLIGERSFVQGNGMLMLRGELDPSTCGEPSFDGKLNVLGDQHSGPDLTRTQLPLLSQAVEYAHEALSTAFPGWTPLEVWLKRAEGCRDLPFLNAISATRVVQHAAVVGSIERRWDEYRRIGTIDVDGLPTLRFITHAGGPQDKVYPKRLDKLRLEVSCPDRASVCKLTGAKRCAFTSQAAGRLFLHFLNAAAPRLDRLEAHVRATLDGQEPIMSLLTALKPLIDRACGERKAKGPASPEAEIMAVEAVESLLSIGMYDARGLHANHAIRRELDALCGQSGPLLRHAKWAIYYLHPRFARACAVMRGPVAA